MTDAMKTVNDLLVNDPGLAHASIDKIKGTFDELTSETAEEFLNCFLATSTNILKMMEKSQAELH